MSEATEPRSDLADAATWLLLGAAVLAGSITMDRLAEQDVPPFAAPGLVPGLLGLLLLVLGSILLVRAIKRGKPTRPATVAGFPARALLVIGLCVVFGAGLVGRGLPFWAAAALFVTVAILLLRQGDRQPLGLRSIATALTIGLAAGAAITVVFQQLFLVRLP